VGAGGGGDYVVVGVDGDCGDGIGTDGGVGSVGVFDRAGCGGRDDAGIAGVVGVDSADGGGVAVILVMLVLVVVL